VNLFGRKEQANRHRQIVGGNFFAKVGGSEIYGYSFPPGKGERRVFDRRANTLTGFLNRGIWQPNNRRARLTVGNVYFDIHECAVESDDCATRHFGEQ
jgi:hypothetical protein